MLNALSNSSISLTDVYSLLEGHHRFLQNNTGETIHGDKQHYAINPEGILSNNRHFIAYTQQEAMPNGDATTEGQSLLIIGYCYSYMATGDPKYLERAKYYFKAYIDHFYQGQAVPTSEQAYISNWLINGKEKTLANYPLSNDNSITHAGFKGDDVDASGAFVNMFTFDSNLEMSIPHGAPHWGQYLDRATFAYEGNLVWNSIVATVYGTQADGSTDWTQKGPSRGKQYDVEWAITWDGKKMSYDDGQIDENPNRDNKNGSGQYLYNADGTVRVDRWGNKVSNPVYRPVYKTYSGSDIGRVKLKPTYLNKQSGRQEPVIPGTYKFNYATKNPVSDGGYELDKNEAWHNRPCVVPMKKKPADMGNSSDSEQWFGDAAYLLFKLTDSSDPDNNMYYNVWRCVHFNCLAYTDIDSKDKFFRVDAESIEGRPWTDGISYYYTYPSKDYQITLPTGENVVLSEVIKGYKDAAALAAEVEEFQNLQTEFVEKNEKIGHYLSLAKLEADRTIEDYNGFDWGAYKREDPAGYVEHREFLDKFIERRKEIVQAMSELESERVEKENQSKAEQAAAASAELLRDIPGWNQDLYVELMEYAVANGKDKADIEACTDPLMFKMLYKALQFEKGKAIVKAKVKKLGSPTKVAKPNAKPAPESSGNANKRALLKRITTGGVTDTDNRELFKYLKD